MGTFFNVFLVGALLLGTLAFFLNADLGRGFAGGFKAMFGGDKVDQEYKTTVSEKDLLEQKMRDDLETLQDDEDDFRDQIERQQEKTEAALEKAEFDADRMREQAERQQEQMRQRMEQMKDRARR